MCMITVKYHGSELPKDEHLVEASLRNKDGIGVCYWKFGTTDVHIKKDFGDVNKMIMWLKENITKEDVCIIHFRLATHGLVDVGNRHPFPITKNKELLRKVELVCQSAVAHNGVLSQYGEHKKFSDTQKFVLEILAEETIKNNLDNEKIRKLIGTYIGNDKLAILSNNGTVYLFGQWLKEGDILYSNDGYVKFVSTKWRVRRDEPYLGVCEGCGKETACMWMPDTTREQTEWFLCKACRKAYRKGRLKVEEFLVNLPDDELLQELHDEDDKDILNEKLTDKNYSLHGYSEQCESCLEWNFKGELVPYYGAKLCKKCVKDLPNYGNSSLQ